MGIARVVASGAAMLISASGAAGGEPARSLPSCPPPEQPSEQAPAQVWIDVRPPLQWTVPDPRNPSGDQTVIPPLWDDQFSEAVGRALAQQRLFQELLSRPSLASERTPAEPFMPVEHAGLIAQLTSISAQVSLSPRQFGRPGVAESRSLTIAGSLSDLSGTRAFRIVGPPRLVELTDEQGRDLRESWQWSAYPDAGNPQAFTRPNDSPGSMTQQTFSIFASGNGPVPRRIGVLRVELSVAVGSAFEEAMLSAEVSEAYQQVAEGVEARVTMTRREGEYTHLGVEYRLARQEGSKRPWFVRAEILDDEQRVLATVETANEVETLDSVIGSAVAWNVDTRRAPAYHVRLLFVPSERTTRLEIVERDVPLMGG